MNDDNPHGIDVPLLFNDPTDMQPEFSAIREQNKRTPGSDSASVRYTTRGGGCCSIDYLPESAVDNVSPERGESSLHG